MTPIIGITDSQKSGHLVSPTGYFALATATVASGSSTTLTFTDIPQTYTDLEIRIWTLTPSASGDLTLRFNGDSSSGNYTLRYIYTSGSGALTASSSSSSTYIPGGISGGSSIPSYNILKIPFYTDTTKNKIARTYCAANQNGGAGNYFFLHAGEWKNTNPITSITLGFTNTGFNTGTYATLYGIK